VALVGEPGIGKTRLLTELGRQADARDMLVLTGGASEFESDMPFWIFVDALDEYLRGLPPQRLAPLDDDVRAELGHVLPTWSGGEPPRSPVDQRYRTHAAMRRLLELLAASAPVVLLLDDLHWADSGSVELLCALLRRPPTAPVLIGMAFRPRQVPSRLAAGLGRATRLELDGLSLDGSLRLLGPGWDRNRAVALHTESGGNPFYLRQLARSPTTSGPASDQDAACRRPSQLPWPPRSPCSTTSRAGHWRAPRSRATRSCQSSRRRPPGCRRRR